MSTDKHYGILVLVRHGQSTWNELGKWTGWTDIPLTTKGQEEAKKAAHALGDIHFDGAYVSDLKRAQETLELIKDGLNQKDLPTTVNAAYKERNYGIYTGKNKWEVKKEVGDEKFLRLRRSWDEPVPQGECLKDVFNRVIPAFKSEILPLLTSGKNILFVAHGNSNRALMKFLGNIPDSEIASVEIATGEIMVYHVDTRGIVISSEKRAVNQSLGNQ